VLRRQVAINDDRLAEGEAVNQRLAIHAHGEGLPGAHIAENIGTIDAQLVAIIVLAGLDAEVDVLPASAGGEGGCDLAGALQIEQQFALVVKNNGNINDITFSGQQGGDVGVGVLTDEAVNDRVEFR
jgi:hypothetical protein